MLNASQHLGGTKKMNIRQSQLINRRAHEKWAYENGNLPVDSDYECGLLQV